MKKNELRQNILAKRRTISIEDVTEKSNIINKKILEYLATLKYESIAVYYPIHKEVDIKPIFKNLWDQGKNILLPYAKKNGEMDFKLFEKNTFLTKDDYGIQSPKTTNLFPTDLIDVALVPCVSCDKKNNRIGYGAGFYDRFLNKTDATGIGVCFDFQLVEKIPTEKQDEKLTTVITD